ncbi:MAG: hypothetical protein ACREBB_01530 [Nitrosotalea sp.]
MLSKLPVVLLVTAVLMVSIAVSAIPASSALIQRDYSYLNDNHQTVLTGDTKVCGDHMCAPGEWDKLQSSLSASQMGNQTGRNATTTTVTPMTSSGSSSSLCTMVKNALSSANADPTVAQSVLSKLGC